MTEMIRLIRRSLAASVYHLSVWDLNTELTSLREKTLLSPKELDRVKTAQLKNLLEHVRRSSRFYQKRLPPSSERTSSSGSAVLLQEIPFLSDGDLQSSGADRSLFCSEPRRRVTRRTAGTSGTPKIVELDKRTMARQFAVRAFFLESVGLSLGARELRLWGRARNSSLSFRNFLLNRDLVTAEELWAPSKAQSQGVLDGRVWSYAYGYSSMVLRLAELWATYGIGRAPFEKAIFTAESMSEEQRSYAENAFRRKVIGEYGSTETDILAFGCDAGRYHLVEPNFIFEAMSVPGESDVVEFSVTDLSNFRTPLIRYRLGDLVEGFDSEYSCTCGLPWASFKSVRGRTADRLVQLPGGAILHAGVFSRLAAVLPAHGISYSRFLVEEKASGRFRMTLSGVSDQRAAEARQVLLNAVDSRFGGLPPGCLQVAFGEIPQAPGAKFSYFVRSSSSGEQSALSADVDRSA